MSAETSSACDYCGLPLPQQRRADDDGSRVAYCCFGCRFAASMTASSGEEGLARSALMRLGLSVFCSMNVLVFTMVLWSWDVYVISANPANTVWKELLRYACMAFSAPVLILLGLPIFAEAVSGLRRLQLTSELLLALSVAAAFAYSAISLITGSEHIYFEVGCMVLLAVTLGRWLEATGKLKATHALRSLDGLVPTTARLLSTAGEQRVELTQLQVGDRVRVLPGERIPIDGRVDRNSAALDQQLVTGESRPVLKQEGDRVYAGTLNLDGNLIVHLDAAEPSTLQKLIDRVVEAASKASQTQRQADRISAWFVPLIAVVAAGTFLAHLPHAGFHAALMASMAVVLIACPCALGIATPLVWWVSLGRASNAQVLFRDGDCLGQLAKAKVICFDKTGTLTTGVPEVVQFESQDASERQDAMAAANCIASSSIHGLSAAIKQFTSASEQIAHPQNLQTIVGKGLAANVDGIKETVYLGSPRLMEDAGMASSERMRDLIVKTRQAGATLACIGWAGQVRGVFVFRESLRDNVEAVLRELSELGLEVAMLTGDHSQRAESLQARLGIQTQSELLPEDKLAAIRSLRARYGEVAMVGDGLNDAPALAEADIGIAMGAGADVSRESAGICLLANDLSRIPWAIRLARRAVTGIRRNLIWAFAYNVIGIGLAATGYLNPILAALAMMGSSLLVVTNSLRLNGGETEEQVAISLPTSSQATSSSKSARQMADDEAKQVTIEV